MSMTSVELEDGVTGGLSPEMIRAQLDLLVRDDVFRSSKRSVAFLRYVVEQTLNGASGQIKERTIGVEVFGREPTYDTNLDHIVRTAATELRKRLAIYYGEEKHRAELHMGLVPGSYIPRFWIPAHLSNGGTESAGYSEPATATVQSGQADSIAVSEENEPAKTMVARRKSLIWAGGTFLLLLLGGIFGYGWTHKATPQDLFWKPVVDSQGPVLLAIGEVPNGPPTAPDGADDTSTPLLQPGPAHTVPFADAVTMARVVGALESRGKQVVIRKEDSRTFADLREGPVVLIGAFNNEWSLRLTRQLRFGLALDTDRHVIYIKDAANPTSRSWSWATNQSRDSIGGPHQPALQDYALISRIRSSETGHVVVVIGGLYTYGTQSAGEFLTDPQWMQAISKAAVLDPNHPNLQIVLGTTVRDEAPGPPRVLAVAAQ